MIIDAQGRPFLIECNPRATSGVHLFEPAALGRALMGRGRAEPVDDVRCLAPALWPRRLSAAARAETGPAAAAFAGRPPLV